MQLLSPRPSLPLHTQASACCSSLRLQAIGFKLRIPQRKPWQAMADDAAAAAALVADRPRMLTGVLRGDEAEAEQLIVDLQEQLDRWAFCEGAAMERGVLCVRGVESGSQ